MSVILNMKMPVSCSDCPIAQKTKSAYRCPIASKDNGFSCTVSFGFLGRPTHCPIIAGNGEVKKNDKCR